MKRKRILRRLFLLNVLVLSLSLLPLLALGIFNSEFRLVASNLSLDFVNFFTWEKRIPECEHVGNIIIAALERYRADHGVYPEELSALVPGYLSAIPRHPVGNGEWEYYPFLEDGVFKLRYNPYRSGLTHGCYYSADKKWFVHEGF